LDVLIEGRSEQSLMKLNEEKLGNLG